ncbi:MAG TPA: hypothetical protein V6C64_03820 [Microcoleaceae cyanobacterium]
MSSVPIVLIQTLAQADDRQVPTRSLKRGLSKYEVGSLKHFLTMETRLFELELNKSLQLSLALR